MENKMCSSFLAIKFGLIRHNKCCNTYELSNDVLKKIGTLAAYSKENFDCAKSRHCRHLKGIHSRSDTNRTGAEGLSFYYPRLLHCLLKVTVVKTNSLLHQLFLFKIKV